MVKIYLSEQDGDVHFKTIKSNSYEMDTVVQLFKSNFLIFDSKTKTWKYPIKLEVLNVIDELKYNDIAVDVLDEDIEVIKLASLYPPSQELKRIKFSVDKELLEKHPPLIGKKGFENFQVDAIRQLIQKNRNLLDISCRSGKTYVCVNAISTLYKLGKIDRVFIVCRNEGVENFKNEILRFSPCFTEDDIAEVWTYNRDIEKCFDKKIIITNYITFRLSCAYKNPKASVKSRKPMIDFSKWGNNRLIVLDEVQSINHHDSIQTHLLQLHAEYFEYRYGLSGTLGFNFLNWYSLAKFMLPQRMNMTFSEWRDYITTDRFHTKIDEVKASEFKIKILDKLLITYHDCIIQSENVKVITYCDMGDKFRQMYKDICEKYVEDIFKMDDGKITSKSALLKFGELSKFTSDPSLIEGYENFKIEDNPKFAILLSLLDKYINEQGNRVIIWSVHPQLLNKLSEKLSKYKPLVIHGDASTSVKKNERMDELNAFKKDPSRKVLLTNKVLSTSISVTECCRQIYWDLPLNSDDFEQSIERPRGPMQKETVETNILLFSKSVDIYTWFEILCKKSNVRKAILEKDTLSTQDLKKMLNPDKRYYVDGVEV